MRRNDQNGFTLIEMTVVLALIALTTHFALRQLDGLRDRKMEGAADRQLEEIRKSVYDVDAKGEPCGFLADMGRLVAVTNGTLAELWACPAGVKRLAVVPATEANLVRDMPGRAELADAKVFVATGWRGPYLRLPLGKTRLYDPWGNAMENPDAAGYDRLTVTNGRVVAVSHFGPTALSRGRRTCSLVPDGGAGSRLNVKAVSTGGTASGTVVYKWYGPCSGLVTGAVGRAEYGVDCSFSGLTPGRRVVWDSLSGISRLVDIRPGDNQVEIRVP